MFSGLSVITKPHLLYPLLSPIWKSPVLLLLYKPTNRVTQTQLEGNFHTSTLSSSNTENWEENWRKMPHCQYLRSDTQSWERCCFFMAQFFLAHFWPLWVHLYFHPARPLASAIKIGRKRLRRKRFRQMLQGSVCCFHHVELKLNQVQDGATPPCKW